MDAIAGLLDGPRAREAFLLRSSLDPPWSLLVRDEAPLTVLAMVRGEAWIDDELVLHGGDVAIFRGPDPYTVSDSPGRPPQVAIEPGQVCRSLDAAGAVLTESVKLGVRSWGNAADGETVMLTGSYVLDGEVSGRVLRALPPVLPLRAGEWDCPVIPLLADEIVKDEPGQEAVLDRLLDLLVIAVLRAWFGRSGGWYRAYGDPVVGHALRLLHQNPAHPWTVASLARECGASRAALARRFNELVGEPPMSFLTGWRLALAADLLLEPGATIASVADQVGYSGPFSLSAAFKRVRGLSPQQHRERHAHGTGAPRVAQSRATSPA
jgi:AraC-like DNA-binding protein